MATITRGTLRFLLFLCLVFFIEVKLKDRNVILPFCFFQITADTKESLGGS